MKAEGEKQAAILTAEGVKQRQILEAQGQADAVRALADAERYRSETTATGEAAAIRNVFSAIHDGDPSNDLIAIKYLETLSAVADGQATKIYLPLETAGLGGALAGMAELFKDAGREPSQGEKRTSTSDRLLTPPPRPQLEVDMDEDPEADIAKTQAKIRDLNQAAAPDPGWYPDPERPSKMRWWDGSGWSEPSRG